MMLRFTGMCAPRAQWRESTTKRAVHRQAQAGQGGPQLAATAGFPGEAAPGEWGLNVHWQTGV